MYVPTLFHAVYTCRKFSKTIEILQGDIEALENDKAALEKRLDHQTKKTMLSDVTTGRRSLGGRPSPYTSPYGSPFGSPFVGRRGVQSPAGGGAVGVEGGEGTVMASGAVASEGDAERVLIPESPLLLVKV